MKVVDMHCDTISEIYEGRKKGENLDLRKNGLHLDLEKMKKGDYFLQNFALFTALKNVERPFEHTCRLAETFYEEMEANKDLIGVVKTYDDIEENWKKGKRTHIFLDEFHVVFENEHSGTFFNSAWRRFRKRNAFPTAITQNVEYLLDSVLASTMLSNSEYIVMLNQAASDRQKLAELLNISNEQMSYITNADAGCGLIKYGSSLVPFVNKFPRNTELYRLMTTKFGEV